MNGPYVVQIRVIASRGGRGGRFHRPVKIIVLDTRVSEWHASRGLIAGYVVVASLVDSRSTGPRSAYGIAMAEAQRQASLANATAKELSDVAS